MKFSSLEAAFIADSQKAEMARETSSKSTAAFAAAILAKGGEVVNVTTAVRYRSTDGSTIATSKVVTMADDVVEPAGPTPPK